MVVGAAWGGRRWKFDDASNLGLGARGLGAGVAL
jgi:hypothetical protein